MRFLLAGRKYIFSRQQTIVGRSTAKVLKHEYDRTTGKFYIIVKRCIPSTDQLFIWI